MEKGDFLYHTSCPSCGSSDALAVYKKLDREDGYCWSCNRYYPNIGEKKDVNEKKEMSGSKDISWIEKLPISAFPARNISEEASNFFGVRSSFNQQTGELEKRFYPYYKDGKISGYKVREVTTKRFYSEGDIRGAELFGQNKCGEGGKLLIIVEGEEDLLASHQMLKSMGKNYKVVSLPNGANISGIKRNLNWVEKFESVILCLDQDAVGKKAAKEIASILTPGKAKIMSLSEKDANDMLKNNKHREFYLSLANAKEYRPDGIVRLSQAWDELWRDENIQSIPYPWQGVNDLLYGLRRSELITLTSGSGQGKSAVVRELTHWLFKQDAEANIGILALEENIGRTAWGIMAIEANIPLHIREERAGIPKDKIKKWWEATVGTGRLIAYDHFGSTTSDNLLSQVRYLIKGMDCKWIFLDHLSIVVSAMDEGGDERKTIDSIMTRLRMLVEETGAGLILVSHLRRAAGDKGHEQGLEVSLSHLRGSQSISQLSDAVIALERNQQHPEEKMKNMTQVRVLKNRYAGLTGPATHLYYNRDTGRLSEVINLEEFLAEDEDF